MRVINLGVRGSAAFRLIGWLGVASCAAIGGCGTGTESDSQRDVDGLALPLDQRLEQWIDWYDLPAAAVAVVRGQEITEFAVAGSRVYGTDVPVTAEDKFLLNSNTKAMTATMLGVLVERGMLSWDTRLGAVFPELSDEMDAAFAAVTLIELLAHRAGLPDDRTGDGTLERIAAGGGTLTEQRLALLRRLTSRPPATPPGQEFVYANAGYTIAAAVAERITGESYEQLMRTLLFDPLEMSSAGFGAPGTPGEVEQPRGHALIGGRLEAIEPGPDSGNPLFVAPSGGVHANLADWAKFDMAQLGGARGTGGLLTAATFRELQSPPEGEYALGWYVHTDPELGTVLSHGGTDRLWYSVNYILPDQNLAVIMVTNCAHETAKRGVLELIDELIRRETVGSGAE